MKCTFWNIENHIGIFISLKTLEERVSKTTDGQCLEMLGRAGEHNNENVVVSPKQLTLTIILNKTENSMVKYW